MNEEQQEMFKTLFTDMCKALREDIAKESHTQNEKLTKLETRLEKQPSTSGIKLEIFDGNPAVDALIGWIFFRGLPALMRIASINDWTAENRLNAFPLYLSGIAQAWFLSLREDQQKDLTQIQAAFKERFASGPQNWIISQQLSTRKQVQGERINDYFAYVTRLCKRLKSSDADSIHYFIQGLQPHIQSYVTLARPKDFQEAESLTRMKELVDINQSASDTKSVLSQMEAMFTKLMTQSKATNPQTIAAVSTESTQPQLDKRLDELIRQIKQF